MIQSPKRTATWNHSIHDSDSMCSRFGLQLMDINKGGLLDLQVIMFIVFVLQVIRPWLFWLLRGTTGRFLAVVLASLVLPHEIPRAIREANYVYKKRAEHQRLTKEEALVELCSRWEDGFPNHSMQNHFSSYLQSIPRILVPPAYVRAIASLLQYLDFNVLCACLLWLLELAVTLTGGDGVHSAVVLIRCVFGIMVVLVSIARIRSERSHIWRRSTKQSGYQVGWIYDLKKWMLLGSKKISGLFGSSITQLFWLCCTAQPFVCLLAGSGLAVGCLQPLQPLLASCCSTVAAAAVQLQRCSSNLIRTSPSSSSSSRESSRRPFKLSASTYVLYCTSASSSCGNVDNNIIAGGGSSNRLSVILDSGASYSATGCREILDDFQDEALDEIGNTIRAANGYAMSIRGRGSISLPGFTLPGVLYVPELRVNVVSTSQLTLMDYSVSFDRNGCLVREVCTEEVVGRGRLTRNMLYQMENLAVPLDRVRCEFCQLIGSQLFLD